ncbi:MAG TPA: glycosyltransferase family 9 protein [Tahibacter sp.]|nr:glycosyltransferase family 9 protein [Tahibacter sp.]
MRLLTGPTAVAETAVLPPRGIFRIAICRVSHSLGNTLLITPLLQEIEATWPGAEVDIVTRNPIAPEVFGGFACVRDVIVLPRQGLRHPLSLLRGVRRLQRTPYDLAIDTDPRSQTGRALLLRIRSRYKLGFAGDRKSGTINCAVDPAGAPRHNGHFPVYLLRTALQRTGATYPVLDLRLTRSERDLGAQALARLVAQTPAPASRRGIIGVFANATGRKRLSADWWRAFMPAIEAHYADYAIVEIVPVDAVSMLDSRYPAYYSSQVRKLATVLSQLSLLICLDCGVMHLARAAGTRTAAVFTETEIAEWGPYGDGAHIIEAAGLSPEQAAHALIRIVDVAGEPGQAPVVA